jgi:hypothetical protein
MTTTQNTQPTFDVRKHHDGLISLLRTLEGTKLPVKLRRDSATGPVVTCTIHHVHKGDRIEILSEELAQSTKFADAASFYLNLNEIYGVEVGFAVPKEQVITEDKEAPRGPQNGHARTRAGARS